MSCVTVILIALASYAHAILTVPTISFRQKSRYLQALVHAIACAGTAW